MVISLYRKQSISLAYYLKNKLYGTNLNIWYGISGIIDSQSNMIIDASIVKKQMDADLEVIDHTCLPTVFETKLHMMENIACNILETANKGTLVKPSEIVVCDCQNDRILITDYLTKAVIKYLHNPSDESITIPCLNYLDHFGWKTDAQWKYLFLSSRGRTHLFEHLDSKAIYDLVEEKTCPEDVLINWILSIDPVYQIGITELRDHNPKLLYLSVVRELPHQITVDNIGKCYNLHGHAYRIEIFVHCLGNKSPSEMYDIIINTLDEKISLLLSCNDISTTERFASSLYNAVNSFFSVKQLIVHETENIMVSITDDEVL